MASQTTMAAPGLAPDRVLMTADAVGGVWTYALELSSALASHGTCVTLATLGPPPSAAQQRAAAAVPGLELVSGGFRLEWMDDPWDDVERAADWLLELEERARPDLVHLNGFCHGALPWRAPVLVVGHSCVLSWWRAVKGGPAPRGRDRYREAVREGLQAAGLVVAPSQAMLRELDELYGPLGAARVIANGRSLELPALAKQPLVLCAGRLWDEAKNLAALQAAAPGLAWPVYVAGEPAGEDGRGRPGLRALGRLEEPAMAAWLARASVYAHPALYEPFGLSVLEAALAGCALVLGDLPSLRENWDGAAVFAPPRDHASLAGSIRALIADPASRALLAGRARERARWLGPERMARGYLSAYGWLLRRGWEESACAS